jgi:LPS-assembly lipoprotein
MNAKNNSLSSQSSAPVLTPAAQLVDGSRRLVLRRFAGAGALVATATALSGCGFALRKAPEFVFDTVYVTNRVTSTVAKALQRELTSAGLDVIAGAPPGPKARAVVLGVIRDQRERTVVGQTTSGEVRELELRYRFRFNLATPTGKRLIDNQEILLTRDISFSETDVYAKAAEEQLMYTDMQSDLVQQVMRRLAAIKSL